MTVGNFEGASVVATGEADGDFVGGDTVGCSVNETFAAGSTEVTLLGGVVAFTNIVLGAVVLA